MPRVSNINDKNAKKKYNNVKASSFKEGEFYEELKNMAKRRANKDI